MRMLEKKLVRDLARMRAQATAIALVVACGVAVYVSMTSALYSLAWARAAYYDRYRLGDVFASVERAPVRLADAIARIPGVSAVRTRIVKDVSLDVPGMAEPAVARLVSIGDDPAHAVNGLALRQGRFPDAGRVDEVVAAEAFTAAHRMRPGDGVSVVVNGKKRHLSIVGIALSPEYVFQLGGGDVLPDDRRFGVFWMHDDALAAALDMRGAFDDVSLELTRGASEADVVQAVTTLLAPYGCAGAHGRDRLVSHRYLSDELRQLESSGRVVPLIFLGVAAFLLNVVLSRLVGTQRSQIGTLKAFGYSSFSIALHYVELVLAIVLAGAVLGVALGVWAGDGMMGMYRPYYRFPSLDLRIDAVSVAASIGLTAGASVLGALGSVLGAARIAPAESMRPDPPPTFRASVLDRLGVSSWLAASGRMILRNVTRRPARTTLSALGMAFAVGIVIVGDQSEDAIRYVVWSQFELSARQDATIGFAHPVPRAASRDLSAIAGVLAVEPFRQVPVMLRVGHRTYETSLLGIAPSAELRRVVDRSERALAISEDGLVLTDVLADLLGASVGEPVEVEIEEGDRRRRTVRLAAVVDELVGVSAYMAPGALARLLGEGQVASGAYLAVDPLAAQAVYRQLKAIPAVAVVSVRRTAIDNFEKVLADNMGVMRVVELVFAVVIAASVVYNTARIALSERSRDLASLRVLGFSRGEVSAMLLGELFVITLASLPLGMLIGYGLSWALAASYVTDLFRIPLVVRGPTYAFAAAVVLASALVSGLLVRSRIDRLDLVAVLKSRD